MRTIDITVTGTGRASGTAGISNEGKKLADPVTPRSGPAPKKEPIQHHLQATKETIDHYPLQQATTEKEEYAQGKTTILVEDFYYLTLLTNEELSRKWGKN